MLQWTQFTILATLLCGFAVGGWILRRQPDKLVWVGAWCAILASGVGGLLSPKLPFILAPALGASSLFPVFLLVGSLRSAKRGVPRWLIPAGLGLCLARTCLYGAGLDSATALLALAFEPAVAVGAAVIFHRGAVPRRSSPVRHLIAPALLLVAILEAGEALRDLSVGAAHTPWIAWFVVAGPLAALLIISAIDEARRTGANAERRFRRLSEDSQDLIAEAGPDGRFIYMSPNHSRVLGFEPEEFLGRHVSEVAEQLGWTPLEPLRGGDPAADPEPAGSLRSIGRVRKRDGSWRWLDTHAIVHRSPDGELCVIAVSRDVTERIEAEQKHRDLEAQMHQAKRLESLGILAGGIAHDFNNLLVGILANAELALEDLDPGSPARMRTEEIRCASNRASELTQHLLAYAGKADLSPETLDLGALVHELAQLLRASLPETAELRIEFSEQTPWIHADATQVRQVLMNLITNARDALEDRSGVITVRSGMTQVGPRLLERCYFAEGVEAGEFAYVEVDDTGRGIDGEQLRQIFDPFYTTKFQGRGLGLAAVAGIVRGHRGAIQLESVPGGGTRIRVFLPRVAAAVVRPAAETSGAGAWQGQGTVLVVDDEEMVRSVAGLVVERLGFEVLSASGGAEAVELFRKNQREVSSVLLDVTMPEMDGEQTFWALRGIREDVPVLFMSGHSSRDIDGRLLGKSRVGKLRKPFRLAELERGLRGVLEEDSARSA